MKSDRGISSDSTILNDIVEDSGRRGSKSSSGSKSKRAKPAWIQLALTKRKVGQEGWMMDAIRGLFFLFHVRLAFLNLNLLLQFFKDRFKLFQQNTYSLSVAKSQPEVHLNVQKRNNIYSSLASSIMYLQITSAGKEK